MDYSKIYENLIDRAKNRKVMKDQYYQIHHIIPKCLGGSDQNINLVKLKARQHFIAHRLLFKMYPNNNKISYAIWAMIINSEVSDTKNSYRINRNYKINSKLYETLKLYISKQCSKWNLQKSSKGNHQWQSQKHRKRSRQQMMKGKNPMSRFPQRCHKAKPVIVTWEDGTKQNFSYAKQISLKKGIPYNTIKWCLRNKKGSKKNKIVIIVQIQKEIK